ncbi:MAG TPA: SigE family RNA polymerase sigma factor [Jatrophihabitans sp.]|nr:SigE family RNA polymerase sigma factor [Jatrophihabitans sp.]
MADPAEFATFVRVHSTALVSSAFLLTGDRVDAEELVQDTLVRLYPNWARVAQADVPLAYVRRSLTNNFLNGRRRRSAGDVLVADPPETGYEPDLGGRLSDRELVRSLLDRLPARQRAVLVLRFFEELDDGDIAAIVGCRRGTVRSIVSRSLQQLRLDTERRAASGQPRQTNGNLR